jgi:hypothetical protein
MRYFCDGTGWEGLQSRLIAEGGRESVRERMNLNVCRALKMLCSWKILVDISLYPIYSG